VRDPFGKELVVVGALDPDLVAGCSHPAWKGALQNEILGALGVRGREEARQRTAIGDPIDRGPLPADGIHDSADVLHPLVDRRRAQDPV
jgi:hypothetical protein